jgi:O-antigen/teichoic acid export membrane protein
LILVKGKPKWAFYLNLLSLLVYASAFWIGSYYSILSVAIAFLAAGVIFLFPIEFYLRYKLVGMSVGQYFLAMRHLFIAFALPIFAHAYFYLPDMQSISISGQIATAIIAIIFFFIYIFFNDRNLIISTKNLILKGS